MHGGVGHLCHLLGGLSVRAARGVCVDLCTRHGLQESDELRAQDVLDDIVLIRCDLRRRRYNRRQFDLAHGGDERDNLDAVCELEVLLRDCASGDASDGLARAAASAARARLDSVLLKVGPIGVGRAGVQVCLLVASAMSWMKDGVCETRSQVNQRKGTVLYLRVITGALVFVLDEKPNGRAKRDAMFDA